MNSAAHAGFTYLWEVVKNGEVIDSWIDHNLMPTEGANHMLESALANGTRYTAWYLALYEGNYTPTIADTAATLPAAAVECTAYSGSTRKTWTPGSAAAGVVDNSASRAEFTFTSAKTVYGGFLTSASAKSATTGALMSVVKFTTPRVLDIDSVLRVTAGINLTSI